MNDFSYSADDFKLPSFNLDNVLKDIMLNRHQILEDFSRAYLAETGLMPSECKLVQQVSADGMTTTWSFQKRGI